MGKYAENPSLILVTTWKKENLQVPGLYNGQGLISHIGLAPLQLLAVHREQVLQAREKVAY